jgi:hypothetical protein
MSEAMRTTTGVVGAAPRLDKPNKPQVNYLELFLNPEIEFYATDRVDLYVDLWAKRGNDYAVLLEWRDEKLYVSANSTGPRRGPYHRRYRYRRMWVWSGFYGWHEQYEFNLCMLGQRKPIARRHALRLFLDTCDVNAPKIKGYVESLRNLLVCLDECAKESGPESSDRA